MYGVKRCGDSEDPESGLSRSALDTVSCQVIYMHYHHTLGAPGGAQELYTRGHCEDAASESG